MVAVEILIENGCYNHAKNQSSNAAERQKRCATLKMIFPRAAVFIEAQCEA